MKIDDIQFGRREFLRGSALLLATPALMSLVGCGSGAGSASDAASAADSAASAAADATSATALGRVFKHGFDKDFPPYSYIDDSGATTGFDVELAQALCALYGWEYQPVPINWDAKDAELNAGSIDCIWSGFTKSPAREDSYTWSKPYSINKQKIMVKEGSDIKTLADLAGKKVGVQTSTSAYDMLDTPEADGGRKELADTFASVEVYDTYTIAVTDLQAGAIDAVAIDVTTGDFQMSKQSGLVYLGEDLGDEVYAIGFRLDDIELRNQVDAGLEELAANGTMDAIGKNYEEIYENLSMIK